MAKKSAAPAKPTTSSTAAKASAKPAKKEPAPCTPFAIDVAVLTPDDKTKIVFGLSRKCVPKVIWTIHFVLQEIDGSKVTDRVKVDVVVGDDKIPAAEDLAKKQEGKPPTDPQLNAAKLDLLQTRVADRAAELDKGTTSDPELEKLLPRVL